MEENITFLSDPPSPPSPSTVPVLSQYSLSTASVLSQYCLSSAPSTGSVLAPVLPQQLSQYCLSTVSVLSQYCLSTASVLSPVLPQYCLSSPLSTVSVLSQYCPSTVPSPSPLEPPLGFSGETEKKGLWLFLKKHMIHGWKKVFMVGSTTGHKKSFLWLFSKSA